MSFKTMKYKVQPTFLKQLWCWYVYHIFWTQYTSTFVLGWLGFGPHKFLGLDEVMLAPIKKPSASIQRSQYYMVVNHILQEVILLALNNTDLDWKEDKYSLWNSSTHKYQFKTQRKWFWTYHWHIHVWI